MVWKQKDDEEITESLDRLIKKQAELQAELSPIGTVINNFKKIKSKEYYTFDKARTRQLNIMKPKDMWGNDMKDADRIKIKKECIAKTIELLGDPVDE